MVKFVSGSHATHCLIMIHPCVKYNMPTSKQTEVLSQTQKHFKKPYKFDLKVKVQCHTGIMIVRDTLSDVNKPM